MRGKAPDYLRNKEGKRERERKKNEINFASNNV